MPVDRPTRFSTDSDVFLVTERRPGCRVVDDQLHTRAGDRLHETVYEPRYQHPVQAAAT